MYLGQESWGQAGGKPHQQYPQHVRPGGPTTVAPLRPAAGVGAEVGPSPRITISGCKHEVVGPIIRGDFVMTQMNHGKPAYKKEAGANGLVVMIYFWDERDGAASSGWWIGPQIGGNMVWGHHPNRTSATPPTTGWQAPHSAPPDNTLVLAPTGSQGAAAALNGHQGQLQHQQQQHHQQQQQHHQQQQQAAAAQQQRLMQQQQQQLQQQQQQAQRAQWDEQRRRLEEANKKRLEDQQKRLEQQKKVQEELQKKRQEEAQKRMQDMQRQQAEAKACTEIRKVVAKLRTATPENFGQIKEELGKVLGKELDSCGSQKAKVQEESDKALDQADAKMEQIKEQRKKAAERQQELEKQRKEAVEAAQKLLTELVEMVDTAEEAVKEVEEAGKGFTSESTFASAKDATSAAQPVEEAIKAAQEKVQLCLDFLKSKNSDMKVLASAPGREMAVKAGVQKKEEAPKEPAEEKPSVTLAKTTQRVGACKVAVDKVLRSFETSKQAALKKANATETFKKSTAVFKKYDKDRDGVLNQGEIKAYAKGEYKFTLPQATLDLIYKVIVAEGGKGVKEDDFQRLKAAVGAARERARDLERRKAREAREAELAEAKAELKVHVDKVVEATKASETEVVQAAKQAKGLPQEGKALKSPDMVRRADEVAVVLKGALESLAAAQKLLADLGGEGQEVDKDLKPWLDSEKRKLGNQLKGLESQMTKATASLDHFRNDAKKKDALELKALTSKAMAFLKEYQSKKSLQTTDFFVEIAGAGKDSIELASFVAFYKNNQETSAAEAPEEEAAEKEAKAKEAAKEVPLSDEDLSRAFAVLDEEKEGALSQEVFGRLLRVLMKVVKDIAITSGKSIKDGASIRRLELGEVIEVLEGPVKETDSDIIRVRAKTMKDAVEGWVTVAGNQGTHFLKEGGGTYKVVKETILTGEFDIAATKDTTRKLKPGELLEVREWEKKDATGLLRMKCKVVADGAIGYVTTTGNTGIKFVELA